MKQGNNNRNGIKGYIPARLIELVLLLIGGAIAFYILRKSLYFTARNTAELEKVSIELDDPFKKLLLAGFLMLVVLCISTIHLRREKAIMNVLLAVTLLYVAAVSYYWINYLEMPLLGDDSGVCYSVAWQIYDGDYGQFARGGYIANNPHQVGTVMLNLMIFKLFGFASYKPFFYFNALMILGTVFAGDMLVREMEKRNGGRTAELLWLLFSAGNVPAFLYINYMYGEVASYTGMIIVSWMLFKYVKTEHLRWALGSIPFVAISVYLRKNTIIFIVAAILLLVMTAIWKRRWRPILFAVCVFLAAQVPSLATRVYYSGKSNYEITSGMPSQLYIAMGMQDEWNGPGWYNDYNRVVFAEQNGDIEASKAIANAYIRDRLNEFKANPEKAKDFYERKLISQWAEPSYDSMFNCLKTSGGNGETQAFIQELTGGTYTEWFWKYCNTYQVLIYLGFFLYILVKLWNCIRSFFKEYSELSVRFLHEDMAGYICLVTVIGGFLFSFLWEAKSRYIVEYLVMMLPMAALGYTGLANGILKAFKKE